MKWTKKPNPFSNHPQMQRHMCLVGHYVSPSFLFVFLVAVVATPAATARVSIVVAEASTVVVTIARGLVSLGGRTLVTKSTESTVLGVQLRVAAEGLLTLLALERGKTSLCLGLTGDAVGSRSRTVLGEGGAGTAGLGGFKALGLVGGNGGLSGDRRVLAKAALGTAENIGHPSTKGIGASSRLVVRLLGRASAAVD